MSYLGITARAFGDEGTFSRTGDAHHRHEKVVWASAMSETLPDKEERTLLTETPPRWPVVRKAHWDSALN